VFTRLVRKSTQTFEDAFDPRANAFSFLRFALALLVIFSHCHPLGGFGPEPLAAATGGEQTLGLVAVALFFVLSGFLITRSSVQAPSTGRFLWHRFLRIYPGYWVCLILTALVFAPIICRVEHGSFTALFGIERNHPLTYITRNFTLHMRQFTIASLMRSLPYPWIVNGSLWSLSFELVCYFAVAVMGWIGIFRRARGAVLGMFLLCWGLHLFDLKTPALFHLCLPFFDDGQGLRLFLYFLGGSVFFLFREKIPCDARIFAAAVIALPLATRCGGFSLVAPIALPYALLWLAFTLPLSRFDRWGDFSYGLYIYAFPVQQTLAMFQVHRAGLVAYFLLSTLITLALAIASYRLVEAPCLRLKHIVVGRLFSRGSVPIIEAT
jgi:peptidoglycan/LPS O-acetylase OafA/YrhL